MTVVKVTLVDGREGLVEASASKNKTVYEYTIKINDGTKVRVAPSEIKSFEHARGIW